MLWPRTFRCCRISSFIFSTEMSSDSFRRFRTLTEVRLLPLQITTSLHHSVVCPGCWIMKWTGGGTAPRHLTPSQVKGHSKGHINPDGAALTKPHYTRTALVLASNQGKTPPTLIRAAISAEPFCQEL